MASGRSRFNRHQGLIALLVKINSSLPRVLTEALLLPFLRGNGNVGLLSRYLYLARRVSSLGRVVYIARDIVVKNEKNLSIGNNVSIHQFCYIDAVAPITIGDDVSIAHGCSLVSFEHSWNDESRPIKYNPVVLKSIVIENDVWLGCGVRILAGSVIRSRVVVAAGAVVRGELESGYLYAGVPAKRIKPL